jgi:hypothetical protein
LDFGKPLRPPKNKIIIGFGFGGLGTLERFYTEKQDWRSLASRLRNECFQFAAWGLSL